MTSPLSYHLLLTSEDRLLQHGWWGSGETAHRMFSRWVGEYGSLPGARVTLTDEKTGEQLAAWPDDPGRIFHDQDETWTGRRHPGAVPGKFAGQGKFRGAITGGL
ncbi:hypothetical protein ABT072_46925 [Streptomyces sp. NPDC002589]|uniref:hypothetical protein n=1 Tax=Streptomyces sp. NPDC002589 TaxID=3154420 RepID=UPI003324D6EA